MAGFDFTKSLSISERGILHPDDVRFFYYGFSLDYEMEDSYYSWSEEIVQFIKDKGLEIESIDENSIPEEPIRNKLYFAVDDRYNEDKIHAFFRHLRNAFAHYRIAHEGDYLRFTDCYTQKDKKKIITMNGLIKYKDFRELCQLFFYQKSEIMDRIGKI